MVHGSSGSPVHGTGFQISINYLKKLNAKCIPNSSRPPLSFWEGVILCDLPCARTYACFLVFATPRPVQSGSRSFFFSGRELLSATCLAQGLMYVPLCFLLPGLCKAGRALFRCWVRPALRKAGHAFSLGVRLHALLKWQG